MPLREEVPGRTCSEKGLIWSQGPAEKAINCLIPDSRPKSLCLASIFFWLPPVHSYYLPAGQEIYKGLVQGFVVQKPHEPPQLPKAAFHPRQRMLCPLALPSLFFTLQLSKGVLYLYPSSIQKPGCKEKPIDNEHPAGGQVDAKTSLNINAGICHIPKENKTERADTSL